MSVRSGALLQKGASRSLVEDANAYAEVRDLVERVGLNIVPGMSRVPSDWRHAGNTMIPSPRLPRASLEAYDSSVA